MDASLLFVIFYGISVTCLLSPHYPFSNRTTLHNLTSLAAAPGPTVTSSITVPNSPFGSLIRPELDEYNQSKWSLFPTDIQEQQKSRERIRPKASKTFIKDTDEGGKTPRGSKLSVTVTKGSDKIAGSDGKRLQMPTAPVAFFAKVASKFVDTMRITGVGDGGSQNLVGITRPNPADAAVHTVAAAKAVETTDAALTKHLAPIGSLYQTPPTILIAGGYPVTALTQTSVVSRPISPHSTIEPTWIKTFNSSVWEIFNSQPLITSPSETLVRTAISFPETTVRGASSGKTTGVSSGNTLARPGNGNGAPLSSGEIQEQPVRMSSVTIVAPVVAGAIVYVSATVYMARKYRARRILARQKKIREQISRPARVQNSLAW